ncbi:hypothetical protein DE146DRAFT_281843 [Phaeosphaeria sp. MPI-PUGE-AT-0046c]|nr:hypothetical protein DE146DRAFT_281843 [Phaeosphaeria sp. MPI-PUGE-AT-0046c]
MLDGFCSTANPSIPELVASGKVSTISPQAVSTSSRTDTTLSSTLVLVAADPALPMSKTTPDPVTYCSTKTQTAPPPNAAAFEQAYGRPALMPDLEHRIGLAGNGRYSAPSDKLHGVIFGTAFSFLPWSAGKDDPTVTKPTYAESGFQFMPHELRQRALVKAKLKASNIASKFKKLAAEDGYVIWAESKDEMVVHSEQFGFDIKLDDTGNPPEHAKIIGSYLRNIYKEDFATQGARKAGTAAEKLKEKAKLTPSAGPRVLQTFSRSLSVTKGISSSSGPIPALAPAILVVADEIPEEKAAKDKKVKEKEFKEKGGEEKSSVTRSTAEWSSNGAPSDEQTPVPAFVEWPLVPEENHISRYDKENPSAYESRWQNLVRYDPDAKVPSPYPSTKQGEQEASLPILRKRKVIVRATNDKNSEDGNINYKGLQTTYARRSAVDSSKLCVSNQEPTISRPANRESNHPQQTQIKDATISSALHHYSQFKAAPQHNERPEYLRSTHREARVRSKSASRNTSHQRISPTWRDKLETNQSRRCSRSPERSEGETNRKVRNRRHRALDRWRDARTNRELGQEEPPREKYD